MVTIYQKTNCGLELYPYTTTGQFKNYRSAERYLEKLNSPYNAGAIVITQCNYQKACRLYDTRD